ncbi:MAG: MerR family transcriptional regulator [Myxococcales bacterium]|nr:MerR family transcriptional regulator [Myxococcales bacterium]
MADTVLHSRQVADAAGVHVETLRYYERRGLLRVPRRSPAGYRQYDVDTVQLVRFIKQAQALGFTLVEIAELLALRRPRADRCTAVHAAAVAKIRQIDDKVQHLLAVRGALAELTAQCAEEATPLACPLIEALASAAPPAAPTTSRPPASRKARR